jgi:hypothetical protein
MSSSGDNIGCTSGASPGSSNSLSEEYVAGKAASRKRKGRSETLFDSMSDKERQRYVINRLCQSSIVLRDQFYLPRTIRKSRLMNGVLLPFALHVPRSADDRALDLKDDTAVHVSGLFRRFRALLTPEIMTALQDRGHDGVPAEYNHVMRDYCWFASLIRLHFRVVTNLNKVFFDEDQQVSTENISRLTRFEWKIMWFGAMEDEYADLWKPDITARTVNWSVIRANGQQ